MAKPTITKRVTKGSALTYSELDTNFQNLADATVSLTADTGGTQVTADLNGNITIVAGTNVTITGDNSAKTITINAPVAGSNATTISVTNSNTPTEPSYLLAVDGIAGNRTVYVDTGALYWYSSTNRLHAANITTSDLKAATISNDLGRVVVNDQLNIVTGGSAGTGINIGYLAGGSWRIESTGGLIIGAEMTFEGAVSGPKINLSNGPNGGSISLGTDNDPDDKIYLNDVININSLTSTQRNALVNPQNGDLFYNTTTHKFQGYANGTWVDLH